MGFPMLEDQVEASLDAGAHGGIRERHVPAASPPLDFGWDWWVIR